MTLMRWDPFLDLYDLQRDFARILTRGASEWVPGESTTMETPSTDVFTRSDDLVVRAELPGLSHEDVDVSVEGRTLVVKGERRREHDETKRDYQRREIRYGRFERHVALPEGVDVDRIRATLDAGVLEVTVPRAAELAGAKKVPVETKAERKAILGKGKKEAA